ncbi:MAG: AMP-binding protein, partial [Coriobacteriales bacterium]
MQKQPVAMPAEQPRDYYRGSLFGALRQTAERYPQHIALNFLGRKFSYAALMEHVDWCAAALANAGIRRGDVVAVMLPNCPQAAVAFYAVSQVGAIASMIHPLLSAAELQHALELTGARLLVTMDIFYEKSLQVTQLAAARPGGSPIRIVATSIVDELPFYARGIFRFRAKKNDLPPRKVVDGGNTRTYRSFMAEGRALCQAGRGVEVRHDEGDLSAEPATILFSGGTSGTPKGILLSNGNVNAEAWQVCCSTSNAPQPGQRILCALPLFHGFGLAVCLHFGLSNGLCCMLVPRVTVKDYSKVLVVGKCNYVVGVPTLLGKIMDLPSMRVADLSFVEDVISGGDAIPREMKHRLDLFLERRGSQARVREGYGATECTAAFTVEPREGGTESIGAPLICNRVKVVDPASGAELPQGSDGELLLSGPAVMQCYWNNPEETAKTIEVDKHGCRWLHTGDIARVGADGLVYYRGRIKRMIIASGYNIYPNQIEAELNKLPEV